MIAETLVYAVLVYALLGVIFAIFFLVRGVERVDSQTAGTGILFRLLLLPGATALWPLLLKKYARRSR